MKRIITAFILFSHCVVFAQNTDKFSIYALQGKDTLELTKGIRSYDPIRVFWVNKGPEKIKAIEVTFGNGQLPFIQRRHKLAKGQKLVVLDVPTFRILEENDLASPRKREAEVSRIAILVTFENSPKYYSYTIPFRIVK
jgi:hypothetical protein